MNSPTDDGGLPFEGSQQHQQLQRLLPQLTEGNLSADDERLLADLLATSEHAKRYYLNYIQIHTELQAQWGDPEGTTAGLATLAELESLAEQGGAGNKEQVELHRRGLSSLSVAGWATVCAAIACALLIAFVISRGDDAAGIAQSETRLRLNPKPIVAPPQSHFTPYPPRGRRNPDVAVIVRSEDVDNAELTVGTRLQPGILELTTGTLQLEFMSGAVVALDGPAEFTIESEMSTTMVAGTASAYVPPRARGFTVNAPNAAVVDLGTEFGIRVGDSGKPEVEVLSGEVELSLLGADGSTLLSRRVLEATQVQVDESTQSLRQLGPEEGSKSELPKLRLTYETPLEIPSQYIESVVAAEPLLYWRFDDATHDHIDNLVGEAHSGSVLLRGQADEQALQLESGCIRFNASPGARCVLSEPFDGLNEGDFSIELWLNPDSLSHATCLGISPANAKLQTDYLNVIEIANKTEWIHEPGAIRFLHRSPPGTHNYLGRNAFSPGACTPGRWHHVVATKRSDTVELFLNGTIVRRIWVEEANCPGAFELSLGQLTRESGQRKFVGSIDEVALYRRVLEPDEVAEHYKMVAEVNGLTE